MNYKYILDTSPRKYKCKGCNKSTLVKFINTETGELLSSEFGRCDRESNCGFFKRPKTNLTSDFQYQYEFVFRNLGIHGITIGIRIIQRPISRNYDVV
jgi:hypothetical protein